MDEILYFGKNEFPKLFVNEPYQITRPIKFNFPNLNLIENENENEIKRIKQISANQTTTIFLFQNGKAIKYTENDSNQNPEKIQIENIEKVTLGSDNEAVLTSKGKVFAKGKYINRKNPDEFIKISSLIEDPNDRIIEDVVSGAESIFLLTSNQNVYGIGLNSHAQFGFEDPKTAKKPIFMMSNITRVFTNTFSYSVFLLDSNEELFSCGNNLFGQLGLIESRNEPTSIINFTQIKNLPKGKIIDIQMGNLHSLMLIEDEDENQNPKTKLYSCGFNEFNGLGRYQVTYKFTEIKSPLFENDNIREFFVGNLHTLILTEKGRMIGFGSNPYGQLGNGNREKQFIPIQIELPELRFKDDISNYHVFCGEKKSFLYYSPPPFSNLEEDLIKLYQRKEFCNISFKAQNEEIIEAHKLILKYRLNHYEYQIERLQKIISKKSIQEANQIFEMIYSNNFTINPILYSEIKEIVNSNEKIEETMKSIYLNENEKDFIIERKENQIKFPKLILIMRSELYRGMFLSVTEDTSNKVTDYSELSDESFQILEYWIYSNEIQEEIQITEEIIDEIKTGIDYFQLNQTHPNLLDLLINQFINQNEN